jgi:uncharacterized membrane protein YqaE (UPF0057 family)
MAKFKNYWLAGFGSSSGFATTILLALLFFVPGFIIVRKNKGKSIRILGYILMFIGVALSLGMFSDTAFNSLSNEF